MVRSPYSPSISSEATIRVLHSIFATHGCPEQLVSDNGSGFVSSEFKSFLASLGIEHIQTSPYHASSNGLAERAVQIFKSNVKKLDGDIQTRISTMLFQYRITPQMSTGLSPAEMLMGKKLRNTLDLLHPDLTKKLSEKSQKWSNTGRASKCRKFSVGDTLFACNHRGKTVWIPATVIKITGTRSYLVKVNDGIVLRRHIDQLRSRYPTGVEVSQSSDTEDWPLPRTCLTAPMVGDTDTSGNISESVSIDVPTHPICRSQRSHRQIDFGSYVPS